MKKLEQWLTAYVEQNTASGQLTAFQAARDVEAIRRWTSFHMGALASIAGKRRSVEHMRAMSRKGVEARRKKKLDKSIKV
jgi:hypothetical protein